MSLKSKRAAILVETNYQDLEVWYPYYRLKEEGTEVYFVGTGSSATYKGKFGYPLTVDKNAEGLKATDLDCIIIPGGWAPDQLRLYSSVLSLVKEMFAAGKIVAPICHGGWVPASAGILKGRTMTCYKAIKDDVINAGANYVDQEVCVDGNLISARKPDDLPAFCRAIIGALSK